MTILLPSRHPTLYSMTTLQLQQHTRQSWYKSLQEILALLKVVSHAPPAMQLGGEIIIN